MRSGWWAVLLVALLPYPALAQTPLTLDGAVELAVERSRDVRDAELELESARRRVREAWGSVYPQITANAMYTRNLTVPGSFMPRIFFDPDAGPDELVLIRFGSDNVWNFTMRAEQPLFRAAAFIGVGAAGRYEALQREIVRGRTQAVVTRVRVGYYDVMLAEEGERLTENTVQRIRQTLDEMRKLERAGPGVELRCPAPGGGAGERRAGSAPRSQCRRGRPPVARGRAGHGGPGWHRHRGQPAECGH
jgi:outer membrane protein TolC